MTIPSPLRFSASVAPAALALVVFSAAHAGEIPELNKKVLEYARSQAGKRVSGGACSDLATAALESANARTRFPRDATYGRVWGEAVDSLDGVLPGDILEFHSVTFVREGYNEFGAYYKTQTDYPDHVAIVKTVSKAKGKNLVIGILQQHVIRPGKTAKPSGVESASLVMRERRPGGTLRAYRPIARSESPRTPAKTKEAPSQTRDDQPHDFLFEEERKEKSAEKPNRGAAPNQEKKSEHTADPKLPVGDSVPSGKPDE